MNYIISKEIKKGIAVKIRKEICSKFIGRLKQKVKALRIITLTTPNRKKANRNKDIINSNKR